MSALLSVAVNVAFAVGRLPRNSRAETMERVYLIKKLQAGVKICFIFKENVVERVVELYLLWRCLTLRMLQVNVDKFEVS